MKEIEIIVFRGIYCLKDLELCPLDQCIRCGFHNKIFMGKVFCRCGED